MEENIAHSGEVTMSDYLSGQISFTGLGSGTDFQTMIDQLMEVEATHKKQLEYWKESWEIKIEALDELNNSIMSLRTTLSGMDTMDEFLVKSVSSSDDTVLTATADKDAEEGVHTVDVYQLAQNSIWVSGSGVADPASAVAGSNATFTFSYDDPNDSEGPKTISIDVAGDTSLDNLVNLINTDPDNPGVRASTISDGDNYYLQLRGMDLGADAELLISNASFGNLGSFSEVQANTDALVKVDGWPTASDAFIRSSTNTLSDALPGVSMTIKGLGSTQLNIETSQESIVENVSTFVEKLNEVRSLFMQLTDVDTDKQQGSVMTGNYAVQLVSSNLKTATAGLAKGFEYYNAITGTGDKYSTLSQLGILTDAEEGSPTVGQLIFDTDKFLEALNDDPDGVAKLFAADGIGDQTVESGSFKYYSHISGVTKAGAYDLSYDVSGGQITNASMPGQTVKIDNTENTITVLSGDAKGMVIKVLDTTTDGTFGGSVQLKQGKAGELADLLKEYTNENSGPMHIVADNYDNIIENIDKKIDREEERLALKAERMKMKFARLEATLGTYDQINQALNSAIGQLPD